MSGEEYWCSNNASPSSLQKKQYTIYNLRSYKKKKHKSSSSSTKSTKSSIHTFSRVSNKRAKRRRRPNNRLRRGGKNYGVGRLFTQIDNVTGHCTLHILRRREYSAEDCITPNGIDGIFTPPSATNNDGSVTCCIDNINIVSPLELYEQIKVVEKNIAGRKYNIAAISRDNGYTWRFACILYLHPELVLYSHSHYNTNQKLVVEKEIHSVNMVEMYNKPPIEVSFDEATGIVSVQHNTFDAYYVNKITSESNAEDGLVECNVNRGPDKLHSNDASSEHNAAVDKAIREETKIIQQLKKKNDNFTSNKSTANFFTSRQKDSMSLAHKKRITTFDRVLDLNNVPNRGVAIPLPPSTDNYTTIETCFVPPGNLSKLYEISENEEQQIKRESFINKVRNLSTSTETVNVSSVPYEGLVLEGSTDENLIGTTDKSTFSWCEPRERVGSIIAQWVKTGERILIHVPLLVWSFDFSFGSPSHSTCCKRRVTSNFGKINKYFGRTRSSQPSARPRTGKESARLSNRWNESGIRSALFLPMLNWYMDLLTAEANMFSKAADNDLYNFYTEVFKQAKGGEQLQCNNRPAYGINDMALFTLGFFCTEHDDGNDSFGSQFASRGLNYATSALHHCLGESSSISSEHEQSVESLLHILRQGRQSNGVHNWRLPATCGYEVSFPPGNDNNRKACVLFLYDSIQRAVKIPLNRRSYQTWDTSLRHQTMMPYTYDDDYIYLNDKNLSVLGWGCGKGRKREFLEARLSANVIPNGPIQINAFLNVIGPREHLHQPAIAEGLTTQQRITDWLQANGHQAAV